MATLGYSGRLDLDTKPKHIFSLTNTLPGVIYGQNPTDQKRVADDRLSPTSTTLVSKYTIIDKPKETAPKTQKTYVLALTSC
eukprot:UN11449